MSRVSIVETASNAEFGISPSEPVIVSFADTENLRRFPYGYPHIVHFRDDDGDHVFAVRMRMLSGRFDVIGDTSANLGSVQNTLADLIRQLMNARWRDLGWEDDEDIGAAFDAAWRYESIRGTSFTSGRNDFVWPHLNLQNIDRTLLASLPELCPIVVEHGFKDGSKKYAAAHKRGRGVSGFYYWRSEYEDSLADIQWLGVSNMGVWEKHVRPQLDPERPSPAPR